MTPRAGRLDVGVIGAGAVGPVLAAVRAALDAARERIDAALR